MLSIYYEYWLKSDSIKFHMHFSIALIQYFFKKRIHNCVELIIRVQFHSVSFLLLHM